MRFENEADSISSVGSMRHVLLIARPYLVMALLVLLFFQQMVFSDLILGRGDTFLYFYPNWQFAADALRAGRIPSWNPHIFMGTPFVANSQVGFFYPFNWPLWLLFEVPTAVKVAIVGHIMWATCGTYKVARSLLRQGEIAAISAAVFFGLGGYLTAQVEHVNQLQGLAWLPWLILCVGHGLDLNRIGRSLLIALIFALQLLAGHTQSLFISGVAAGIWLLASRWPYGFVADAVRSLWRPTISPLVRHWGRIFILWRESVALVAGALFALALAGVQLLPTLELMQRSSRQGGLSVPEVLSFSWHPLLAAHSLLPLFDRAIFTEYVAFLPASALALAIFALTAARLERKTAWQTVALLFPLIALVLIGLFLALGRFNIISWGYARLPGFNLFRVPARWLILYSFGGALLAGAGMDRLLQAGEARPGVRLWVGAGSVLALVTWGYLSSFFAPLLPTGAESPYFLPSAGLFVVALAELGLLIAVSQRRTELWARFLLVSVPLLSLYAATRVLPYNRLTTPEAYTDQRPPSLRLQAETADQPLPGRFLSLSQIFFDPGDLAEIETIYAGTLPAESFYDYTIAIKLKEIIAPNFPMVYQLDAVDGFDGGVLPLKSYSQLVSSAFLQGETTTDGRLREFIDRIPDDAWLDRLGVQYIITDKVGDLWIDGVFFDRQRALFMEAAGSVDIGHVPDFAADEIWIIFERADVADLNAGGEIVLPHLNIEVDGALYQAHLSKVEGEWAGRLWSVDLGEVRRLGSIRVVSMVGNGTLHGISLVNREDGTFAPLVPGAYRQIQSGDVKIYENLDAWPRAVLLPADAEHIAEVETPLPGVTVLSAEPEEIVLSAALADPGRLVITEADYPGWRVTVNGVPAEIGTFDRFFKSLELPAGQHEVRFFFDPLAVWWGAALSILALAVWIFLWFWFEGWEERTVGGYF